jgi:hypothetical protein
VIFAEERKDQMSWLEALETFCDLYERSNSDVQWIVVGSVGSVLQGAEMTPNDLDLYVQHEDDLKQLASMMEPFHLKSKCELPYSDRAWHSSAEEPYFTQTFPSGFSWMKGKWEIAGFPIEIVHIAQSAGIPDSADGEGIWEGGRHIWSLARRIRFATYEVPVVPLEIQLESNFRRNRPDRANAIIQTLKKHGFDRELLEKALSNANKTRLKEIAPDLF